MNKSFLTNFIMTGFFLAFMGYAGFNFFVGNTLAKKLENSFEKRMHTIR